jgi:hypothetical protein
LRAYKLWIKVTTSSTHNILSPQFQALKFGAKAMIITAGEKEKEEGEEEEEVTWNIRDVADEELYSRAWFILDVAKAVVRAKRCPLRYRRRAPPTSFH